MKKVMLSFLLTTSCLAMETNDSSMNHVDQQSVVDQRSFFLGMITVTLNDHIRNPGRSQRQTHDPEMQHWHRNYPGARYDNNKPVARLNHTQTNERLNQPNKHNNR